MAGRRSFEQQRVFEHLHWYLSASRRPVGNLERTWGAAYGPTGQPAPASNTAASPGTQPAAAPSAVTAVPASVAPSGTRAAGKGAQSAGTQPPGAAAAAAQQAVAPSSQTSTPCNNSKPTSNTSNIPSAQPSIPSSNTNVISSSATVPSSNANVPSGQSSVPRNQPKASTKNANTNSSGAGLSSAVGMPAATLGPVAQPSASSSAVAVAHCSPGYVEPAVAEAPSSSSRQNPAAVEDTETVERAPPIKLDALISFLEDEVAQKSLGARADAARIGGDPHLLGHGLRGQEALDAYIAELVAIIRDFPYERLSEDRAVGAWVRDDIVAPSFQGSWDFYSNRKRHDLDISSLHQILCGERMLIHRLQYANKALFS